MKSLRSLPVALAFALAFQAAPTSTAKAAPAERQSAVVMAEICLWSDGSPVTSKRKPACRNVQLTPGEAGPRFASLEACIVGLPAVMKKWFSAVGEVFSFNGYAGKGYKIIDVGCDLRSPMPKLGS